MSEQRSRDPRYAVWWMPMYLFLLTMLALVITISSLKSQVRDLQRRVGTLEQVNKR